MTLYNPYVFEDSDGYQLIPPKSSQAPEGFHVPEDFRSLPGDRELGVPDQVPGPNGWVLRQFLNLQTRILNPMEFNRGQQRTVRELVARVLPILDLSVSFPITPHDIRQKTRNYHKRGSSHALYAEYVLGWNKEAQREDVLMLHLDVTSFGLLSIFDADCHRDCLPSHPVTYRDYLLSQEKATLTRKEAALEINIPSYIVEGSPEWMNYLAIRDIDDSLHQLRRRLARVVTDNEDRLIPRPVDGCAGARAVCTAYHAAEPGQPIAHPNGF